MVPGADSAPSTGDAYCPFERTVTCLIIPDDVQALDVESEQQLPSRGPRSPATGLFQSPEDLESRRHNAGERVAMLVGAGALGATDEVIQVADRLGAGVAKALLGKAAVPMMPFVTGSIGLLGLRRRGV